MTSALHKLIVRTWNLGTWIVWRSKYPEPRTQTPKLGCTKWQSYQPIGIWMVQQLSLGWYVICLLLLRYWCTFTYFLVVHMFIVCSREEAGLTPSDWDVLGSFYQEEKREPEKITWAAPFRRNTWPRPWPDLSDRSCEWKKAGTSTGGGQFDKLHPSRWWNLRPTALLLMEDSFLPKRLGWFWGLWKIYQDCVKSFGWLRER